MGEQPAQAGPDVSRYTQPDAEDNLRADKERNSLVDKDQYSVLEGYPISVFQGEHRAAPLPSNEDARLRALNQIGVLDSQQEQKFDDITELVCNIFHVPIAIVSLIDKERQWFKSCVGLNCNQTDRKSSFCAWTLVPKNPEVLVVPDATEDARYFQQRKVLFLVIVPALHPLLHSSPSTPCFPAGVGKLLMTVQQT